MAKVPTHPVYAAALHKVTPEGQAERDRHNALGGHGADWGPMGGRRGNPYHVPGGSPQGGQFTHGPVAKVKAATEHVTTEGHGVADARKNHKFSQAQENDPTVRGSRAYYQDKIYKARTAQLRGPSQTELNQRERMLWPKGVAPPTGHLSGRKIRGH